MSLQATTVKIQMEDGKEILISTGKLARQADGAVTVQCGNCILLATVCASKEPKPGQSFFPLSVDYQEKMASAGKIPGSFFKREGRINDYEILISRLVDRALRPLFPEDYLCDVQIQVTLISSDPEVMPDALACLAASAALAVSNIPIQEIISEVRIARINGQYVINPTRTELATADMDFIIGATSNNIMMVEGEAKECLEADVITAIELAHKAIKIQVKAQEDLRKQLAITPRTYTKGISDENLENMVNAFAADKMLQIARSKSTKADRSDAFKALETELVAHLGEAITEENKSLVKTY